MNPYHEPVITLAQCNEYECYSRPALVRLLTILVFKIPWLGEKYLDWHASRTMARHARYLRVRREINKRIAVGKIRPYTGKEA